jgi:hypothetical protein
MIIKAKITTSQSDTMTRYTYPEGWNAGKIRVVCYQETTPSLTLCIAIIDDSDYGEALIVRSPAFIEELDAIAANAFLAGIYPPTVGIHPDAVAELIEIANKAPDTRTQAEMDFMDADIPETGVLKIPSLTVEGYL